MDNQIRRLDLLKTPRTRGEDKLLVSFPPCKPQKLHWDTFAYDNGAPIRAKGEDGKSYWMARVISVEVVDGANSVKRGGIRFRVTL